MGMELYETLATVGEGSYGTVFKCRHRHTGRVVAVKKLLELDDDKTVNRIALREIKLLKDLRHENLVNLLEVCRHRRRWFLVFEFVEGTVLDQLEQNPGGLDLDTTRRYLYQILRATAFCHQHHVIHRDIKPENILVSQGGVVKLCDFGFARYMVSPRETVVYTDYVATRWYRAPELLVGDPKYGKPVDVWAIGCVLMEMLTGEPLFPGDSDLDQLYHIVRFFGNLTVHHQELFYRNPVFSGVRLPECCDTQPLEQRYPGLSTYSMDLAQECLQTDPESRSQCSDLLLHSFFTHDSFHLRFTDELNAKILLEQRESCTLPKIIISPRRERDDEEERGRRGKDRRQTEERKDLKQKDLKQKYELSSKPSTPARNVTEPLVTTKRSKTLMAKLVENTAAAKSKQGKSYNSETRKDLEKDTEASRLTKTLISDCLDSTLNEKSSIPSKFKHGNVSTSEPSKESFRNRERMRDRHLSKTSDSKVFNVNENKLKTVKSKWQGISLSAVEKQTNHTGADVPKMSKTSTADHVEASSTPKAFGKSALDRIKTNESLKITRLSTAVGPEASFPQKTSTMSISDHIFTSFTPEMSKPSSSSDCAEVSKMAITAEPCTMPTSQHQTDKSNTDIEQRSDHECPKLFLSNPKPPEMTAIFGVKIIESAPATITDSLKALTSDSSAIPLNRSLKAGRIPTPSPYSIGLTRITSNLKPYKTTSTPDTKLRDHRKKVPVKPLRVVLTHRDRIHLSPITDGGMDSYNTSNKDTNMEPDGCRHQEATLAVTKFTAFHSQLSELTTDLQDIYKASNEQERTKFGFSEIADVHQRSKRTLSETRITSSGPRTFLNPKP